MKKRMLCLVLCFSVFFSGAFRRDAYALVVADDIVLIACALLAVGGVTAAGVGMAEAMEDYLNTTGGTAHHDMLSRIASTCTLSTGHEYYYTLGDVSFAELEAFFTDIYNYFTVDGSRTGSVIISDLVGGFEVVNFSENCWDSGYGYDCFRSDLIVPDADTVIIGYRIFDDNSYSVNGVISNMQMAVDVSGDPYLTYLYSSTYSKYLSGVGSAQKMPAYSPSNGPFGLCLSFSSGSSTGWERRTGSITYGCLNWQGSSSSSLTVGGQSYSSLCSGSGFIMHCTAVSVDNILYYNDAVGSVFYPLPADFGVTSEDVELDYGYTFPESLTYEDVTQIVSDKLASGDYVINLGADNVVDGTLPYEEAQEDILTDVLELDIPVTPDLTGIAGLLKLILTAVKAIPTAVVGTGTLNFDAFKNASLATVFPFCIPFDLVNCIRYFNVAETVPSFTFDFTDTLVPYLGTHTLDFSQFAYLAKILKFFVYSIFVAGLVKATRFLIRG